MSGVDKKLAKRFQEFLTAGGAGVLPETNAWEIARFRGSKGICVIYQNSKGRVAYSNEFAHEAYAAFIDGRKWTADTVKDRIRRKTVEELLIERDGAECFYCGSSLIEGVLAPTLEHLLSIVDGGNNHLSNLALSCEPCNRRAASLAITQKVTLRDGLRRAA